MLGLSSWLKVSPRSASAWLSTYPAGEAKDKMVGQLISRELLEEFPMDGLRWAVEISNENARNQWINRLLENMTTEERNRAQQFLDPSRIPQ